MNSELFKNLVCKVKQKTWYSSNPNDYWDTSEYMQIVSAGTDSLPYIIDDI